MVANEPDATCERFLKAREWSVPKATKMVLVPGATTHVPALGLHTYNPEDTEELEWEHTARHIPLWSALCTQMHALFWGVSAPRLPGLAAEK